MNRYVSVCLPRKLTDLIDEKIGNFGYTSRAEFVKEACRKELRKGAIK